LQREQGIGFEEAEAILTGEAEIEDEEKCRNTIAGAARELSTGIERSISFLKTAGDAEQIDEIVLSGGGAKIPWLMEILSEQHDIKFKVNDAVSRIGHSEDLVAEDDGFDKIAPLLTVSLGLALRRRGK
jgi:type IV pilus assembly protein PilM